MCVCVRARARAREARAVILTSGSDFWEMRVLSGFTPVMTFGDFWLLAKPVKFYRRAYMFWWNWFSGFEKNTSFELSRTDMLCDETDETKKSPHKKSWLFRNEWSSFDRLLQPELLTTRSSGSWRSPIVNQKTLIDLGSHSPRTKFYSLQHQLSELDLARLTFFGVRYVLTYSPNHFSAQDVKHLDHQCDSLWSTEVTYEDPSDEACATMQYLSVPLRNQITYLETQV